MKIKCPACSKVLSIPESAAGKVVKCPCGKQLRAPAAKAGAGSAAPAAGAAQPKAAPTKPAAQPSGGGFGGFDPAMFDELTDGDLKPVPGAGAKPAAAPAPSGNTAKLLNEHAATAGGTSSANFRVGPIASPWNRLAAAIIDGFVIAFMAGPRDCGLVHRAWRLDGGSQRGSKRYLRSGGAGGCGESCRGSRPRPDRLPGDPSPPSRHP